jgi:hypothetical protein
MNQITIREAASVALVALSRATRIGERIALRIDREPDFLAALRSRDDRPLTVEEKFWP